MAGSVPLERISTEARELKPARTVLMLLGGLLFGLGWVVARICRAAWSGLAWSVAAVRVGWQDGLTGRPREGD